MSRTIIKTSTSGWFLDPETDKKTRKQDGDVIVSQAEYDQIVLDAEDGDKTAPATAESNGAGQTPEQLREGAKAVVRADNAKKTTLSSGKVVTGTVVEIKCAWVDPDKRTPAQVAIFEGEPKGITYDAVKKAAGGKRSAFPDGTKRIIKAQDAFQTRFSIANQDKWRAELRRRKTRARSEAARAAAKA